MVGEKEMTEKLLTPPCGLYCGFCPLYIRKECEGCGNGERAECELYQCARGKELEFCSLCSNFPCELSYESHSLHPVWLDKLRKYRAASTKEV